MNRAGIHALAHAPLLSLTACSVLFPLDEYGPGPGSDAAAPPGMVAIDKPGGGKMYIDRTEVTRGAYQDFLNAINAGQAPDVSDRPCAWNTVYKDTSCLGEAYKATGWENHPQVCVDWCDAYAYCRWAGKRLCGHVGGGALSFSDYANSGASEWMNACVSGVNAQIYPYGNKYDGQRCNGADRATSGCDGGTGCATTVPVASLTGCTSTEPGYEGVFDLSGNVWEWEDACDQQTGASDNCRRRGGSFENTSSNLECKSTVANSYGPRNNFDSDVGFRCCASAPGG